MTTLSKAEREEIKKYLEPRDGTRSNFEVWTSRKFRNLLSALAAAEELSEWRLEALRDEFVASGTPGGWDIPAVMGYCRICEAEWDYGGEGHNPINSKPCPAEKK